MPKIVPGKQETKKTKEEEKWTETSGLIPLGTTEWYMVAPEIEEKRTR